MAAYPPARQNLAALEVDAERLQAAIVLRTDHHVERPARLHLVRNTVDPDDPWRFRPVYFYRYLKRSAVVAPESPGVISASVAFHSAVIEAQEQSSGFFRGIPDRNPTLEPRADEKSPTVQAGTVGDIPDNRLSGYPWIGHDVATGARGVVGPVGAGTV